jgi:dTDP-4-dehydrorhamnose 3,5-epimerase
VAATLLSRFPILGWSNDGLAKLIPFCIWWISSWAMIFSETRLQGAFLIQLEKMEDERGFFARTFCEREFETHRLHSRFVQCGISYNPRKGTLRGMHYQVPPYEEAKLVRCTSGAIYDVVLDLRLKSATHRQWIAVELTQENHKALYIPEGCAHGFQTLRDETEVSYQMSRSHHAEAARGVRYDDSHFSIRWPEIENRILSDNDRSYEDYLL